MDHKYVRTYERKLEPQSLDKSMAIQTLSKHTQIDETDRKMHKHLLQLHILSIS